MQHRGVTVNAAYGTGEASVDADDAANATGDAADHASDATGDATDHASDATDGAGEAARCIDWDVNDVGCIQSHPRNTPYLPNPYQSRGQSWWATARPHHYKSHKLLFINVTSNCDFVYIVLL